MIGHRGFEVFWEARGICPPPPQKTCFSHPTLFETSGFNLNCLFIPLKIEYLTPIKWYILKFNFWHNKPYWFLCNLKKTVILNFIFYIYINIRNIYLVILKMHYWRRLPAQKKGISLTSYSLRSELKFVQKQNYWSSSILDESLGLMC